MPTNETPSRAQFRGSRLKTVSLGTITLSARRLVVSRHMQQLAFGTTAVVATVVLSESFTGVPPAAIKLTSTTYEPRLPRAIPEDQLPLLHAVSPSPEAIITPVPTKTPQPTNVTPSPENSTLTETSANDISSNESDADTLEVKLNPIPGLEIKYTKGISDQEIWKLLAALIFIYWIPGLYRKIMQTKDKENHEKALREFEKKLYTVLHEMEQVALTNHQGFKNGIDFVVIVNKREVPYSMLKSTVAKIKKIVKSAKKETFEISKDLNLAVSELYRTSMESPISGKEVVERLKNVMLAIQNLGL